MIVIYHYKVRRCKNALKDTYAKRVTSYSTDEILIIGGLYALYINSYRKVLYRVEALAGTTEVEE